MISWDWFRRWKLQSKGDITVIPPGLGFYAGQYVRNHVLTSGFETQPRKHTTTRLRGDCFSCNQLIVEMANQYRARHFSPPLNGNLPGDDASASLLGAPQVFATNPRGVAGRFAPVSLDPANLTMEEVQWDKSTYFLPAVLPPTASSELRSRVLALTLKTLTRSTRGDYATKSALLEQRFQCASAATRARTMASPAKNILGGAYSFDDPLIKRSTGAVMTISDPPSAADKRQGKYLEFRATFRSPTLNPGLTDHPKSFVTAVRLPTDPQTGQVVNDLATKDDWLDATTVMTIIYRQTAALPELLELGELQNGRLQIKEQTISNKMTSFYDKAYFDVLQTEIAKDYVGEAIQNAQSVVQNTRQVRILNGRQIVDPIEVYLKRYASALDLLDEDKPYPIDIVSTCHQNMSDITKKQIKTLGWTEPPKAASNSGQHEQLSRLRTIAIRAEEAIKTTQLVAGTRRQILPSNSSAAFPTIPIFTTQADEEQEHLTLLPPLPEIQVARPPGPPPDQLDATVATGISTLAADRTIAHPFGHVMAAQPVPHATLMEEAKEFQIFLSNSEIAMRAAAGEEDKLCWGGCFKFFPNDTDGRHTYAACPFRRVDRVREHALPHLKRFRQQNGPLNRRVSSLLADPDRLTAAFCYPATQNGGISKADLDDLQANWQDRGFASAEMARSICLMANPNTSKRDREAEATSLKNKIIRNASNKRRREQNRNDLRTYRSQQTTVSTASSAGGWPNNDGTTDDSINNSFILVTLPIFSTGLEENNTLLQNQTVNVPSLLRMSQALPHIDIPVGADMKSKITLRTVFDSGAGLNVGRRSYHENVKKSYPHLVITFVDLQQGNYDTPAIGGVDGNAYGSSVTAIITYRTPFYVGGKPVKLTFGLVDGLCARSILGITTMQKARMNYLVAPQVVTSEAFNYTFQVTMQKPSTDDTPPTAITGNAAVLHAGVPTMMGE